jgi:peptidoglycan/xylan/chitin deacetylase (PgdA/CDA1 family)
MIDIRSKLRRPARRLRRLISRKTGPVILMYHRIAGETFDPWAMAVTPKNFIAHAEWLANNRQVLPLTEFVTAHREQRLPADAAAITFDDGYACTFKAAAPVLESRRLPATVFLPAASLQTGGEFWWDEIQRLVLGYDGSSVTLDAQRVKLGNRSQRDFEWRPYDAPRTPRQKAFRRLWSMIRNMDGDAVSGAMADLRAQTGDPGQARESHRIASVGEVRARPAKLECGCHGLTHASLPALDPSKQLREIEGGRTLLARLIGTDPSTFAFPFGSSNPAARTIVEKAGFLCACGSRQKFIDSTDPIFDLPRLVVDDCDAAGLERMLSGR